ncbi:MAG: DUF3078 domain-containing protein, partial [Bacteroidia bacterium]|nr:DUF3078 domain-containing protein [Bacteroidia bacterium]
GITYNQVALSNWASGGQSNMTLIGNLNVFANRKAATSSWDNSLDLAYGFLKNNFIYDPKGPVTKAEDKIELNSKYGKKAWSEKVFYSGLATFRTQFAKGFAKPLDSVYISRALSPAYLILAAGLDWKPKDYLSVFVSPISGKMTIVGDDSLANVGAFGVNSRDQFGDFRPGSYTKMRMEFGATLKAKFKKDIMKNVGLESNLELFSNYIDRPENIDIRWSNAIVAKINKYLVVNLFTDMIYDHDIAIPQVNPRTGEPVLDGNGVQRKSPNLQFKEVFGLGFSYKF